MSVWTKLTSAKSTPEFVDGLLEFSENYETHLTFDELNKENLRKDVWDAIFKHLKQAKSFTFHDRCLECLRLLSRDKTDLDNIITEEKLNLILKHAGLDYPENIKSQATFTNVMLESLKLLCNLLYNSAFVQQKIGETSCLPCIIKRMSFYEKEVPKTYHEVQLFETRILLLATALNVSLRKVVKNEYNGESILIELLSELGNRFEIEKSLISSFDVLRASERLKVLFNLYFDPNGYSEEEKERQRKLVHTCYKFLVNKGSYYICDKDEFEKNIINLLPVISYDCYEPIIQPSQGYQHEIVYQGMDMTAVTKILQILEQRLDSTTDLMENIAPVTLVLMRIVKSVRLVRKFVRLQILPPLKDVMKRPEEGSTLRAKLCKLLTSPFQQLSDLVAELIFVLCKENVSRMVKYTGYGNAAGMFANKGLLGRSQSTNCAAYSSESEDSDTEEYVKYKENINPVTGCFEAPKPNPLEGMSEEQKEYEAMKLVGLVNLLTKQGIVQPCRIGEDGKPKPIEHILELQDELPKLNINNQHKE